MHTATCEDGDVELVGGISKTEEGLKCFNQRWTTVDGLTSGLQTTWLLYICQYTLKTGLIADTNKCDFRDHKSNRIT